MRNISRIFIVMLVLVIVFGNIGIASAQTECSNLDLVKDYCERHYPECEIKFFNKYDEDFVCNRANTGIIYVEVFHSRSCGGDYGFTKEGWYTAYNKYVEEGKVVKSYLIYNPYTNYCDDLVAVVDNQQIR